MARCNYVKDRGNDGIVGSIIQLDSTRRGMGMTVSDRVFSKGFYKTGDDTKWLGGMSYDGSNFVPTAIPYFPVGPCVNTTDGTSHRVACSDATVSLWQSEGGECLNPALLGVEGSSQLAVDFKFGISGDAKVQDEVVCGQEKGCGYAFIHKLQKADSDEGAAVASDPDVTVWMGIPNMCMAVETNKWWNCGSTGISVWNVGSNYDGCIQSGGVWFCQENKDSIQNIDCIRVQSQESGLKVECDGEGRISSISAYWDTECTQSLAVEEISAADLDDIRTDTVCVEASDMEWRLRFNKGTQSWDTIPLLPEVDLTQGLVDDEEQSGSVKGWMVTALVTAASVAVFAM